MLQRRTQHPDEIELPAANASTPTPTRVESAEDVNADNVHILIGVADRAYARARDGAAEAPGSA